MRATADLDERISKCQALLDQDPSSQIFAALADAYRKKGDLDRAFRICQSGLRTHPAYGSAHIVMAKINLDRGLYDWAETEVKKAIELDNNSRATDLLTAEIHIYKGEHRQATRLLSKLLESDPDDEHIRKLLDIALEMSGKPKATGTGSVPDQQAGTMRLEVVQPADGSRSPAPGIGGVISGAMRLPMLQGAMFVNHEGLVAESLWPSEPDASGCAAAFTALRRTLDQDLTRAMLGSTAAVLIESEHRTIYIVTACKGMFVFVGDGTVNLGNLRMTVSSLVAECHDSQPRT